jgi:hypothetical protein
VIANPGKTNGPWFTPSEHFGLKRMPWRVRLMFAPALILGVAFAVWLISQAP